MTDHPTTPPGDSANELPDHEFLSQLARDDPAAFEALRLKLVENGITSAPERMQARLRGLQFRIDAIRRLSRSPLGATVKLNAMMWESFFEMHQQLQAFVRLTESPEACPTVSAEADSGCHDAQIIEFRPRQSAIRR
ncbi:MAG TPA: DUF3135 domain-containing protein [Azonexus sp.]|nr:DUF3135 domain-containing protein [Azonexus sp.]